MKKEKAQQAKISKKTTSIGNTFDYLKNTDPNAYYFNKFKSEGNEFFDERMWNEGLKNQQQLNNIIYAISGNNIDTEYFNKYKQYSNLANFDTYIATLNLNTYDDTVKKLRENNVEMTDREYMKAILDNQYRKIDFDIIEQKKNQMNVFERGLYDVYYGFGTLVNSVARGIVDIAQLVEGINDVVNPFTYLRDKIFNGKTGDIKTRFLRAFDDVGDSTIGDKMLTGLQDVLLYWDDAMYRGAMYNSHFVDAQKAYEEGYISDLEQGQLSMTNYLATKGSGAGLTTAGQWNKGIADAIGYLLPGIGVGKTAASLSAKGIAKATAKTVSKETAKSIGKTGSAISRSIFYGQLESSNLKDNVTMLIQNGVSLQQMNAGEIVANATLKTAFEYAIEKGMSFMFGGTVIDKMLGMTTERTLSDFKRTLTKVQKEATKLTKVATGSTGKLIGYYSGKIAIDAIKEGLEEVIQDFSNNFIDSAFKGYYAKRVENVAMQDYINSFIVGAMTSVAISTVENNLHYERSMDKNGEVKMKLGFRALSIQEALDKLDEWQDAMYNKDVPVYTRLESAEAFGKAALMLANIWGGFNDNELQMINNVLSTYKTYPIKKEASLPIKGNLNIQSTINTNKNFLANPKIDINTEYTSKYKNVHIDRFDSNAAKQYTNAIINSINIKRANADLKTLSKDINNKVNKMMSNNADELSSAGADKIENILTDDSPVINIENRPRLSKEVGEALKRLGIKIAIGTNAPLLIRSDDIIIIDNKILEDENIAALISSSTYSEVVNKFAAEFKRKHPKLFTKIKNLYKNCYNVDSKEIKDNVIINTLLYDKAFYTKVLLYAEENKDKIEAFNVLALLQKCIKQNVLIKVVKDKISNFDENIFNFAMNIAYENLKDALFIYATQYQNISELIKEVGVDVIDNELRNEILTNETVITSNIIENVTDKNVEINIQNKNVENFVALCDKILDIYSDDAFINNTINTVKDLLATNDWNKINEGKLIIINLLSNLDYLDDSIKTFYIPIDSKTAKFRNVIKLFNEYTGISFNDFINKNFKIDDFNNDAKQYLQMSMITPETNDKLIHEAAKEIINNITDGKYTLSGNNHILETINLYDYLKYDNEVTITKIKNNEIKVVRDLIDDNFTKNAKGIWKRILDIKIKTNKRSKDTYIDNNDETIYIGTKIDYNLINILSHELTHYIDAYIASKNPTVYDSGGSLYNLDVMFSNQNEKEKFIKYLKSNFSDYVSYVDTALSIAKNKNDTLAFSTYSLLQGEINAFSTQLFYSASGFTYQYDDKNNTYKLISPDGKTSFELDTTYIKENITKVLKKTENKQLGKETKKMPGSKTKVLKKTENKQLGKETKKMPGSKTKVLKKTENKQSNIPLFGKDLLNALKENKSFMKNSYFVDKSGLGVPIFRGSSNRNEQLAGSVVRGGPAYFSTSPATAFGYSWPIIYNSISGIIKQTLNIENDEFFDFNSFLKLSYSPTVGQYLVNLSKDETFILNANNAKWDKFVIKDNRNNTYLRFSTDDVVNFLITYHPEYKALYIPNLDEDASDYNAGDIVILNTKNSQNNIKQISKDDILFPFIMSKDLAPVLLNLTNELHSSQITENEGLTFRRKLFERYTDYYNNYRPNNITFYAYCKQKGYTEYLQSEQYKIKVNGNLKVLTKKELAVKLDKQGYTAEQIKKALQDTPLVFDYKNYYSYYKHYLSLITSYLKDNNLDWFKSNTDLSEFLKTLFKNTSNNEEFLENVEKLSQDIDLALLNAVLISYGLYVKKYFNKNKKVPNYNKRAEDEDENEDYEYLGKHRSDVLKEFEDAGIINLKDNVLNLQYETFDGVVEPLLQVSFNYKNNNYILENYDDELNKTEGNYGKIDSDQYDVQINLSNNLRKKYKYVNKEIGSTGKFKAFEGHYLAPELYRFIDNVGTDPNYNELSGQLRKWINDGSLTAQKLKYYIANTKKMNDYTFKMLSLYFYNNAELSKLTYKQFNDIKDNINDYAKTAYLISTNDRNKITDYTDLNKTMKDIIKAEKEDEKKAFKDRRFSEFRKAYANIEISTYYDPAELKKSEPIAILGVENDFVGFDDLSKEDQKKIKYMSKNKKWRYRTQATIDSKTIQEIFMRFYNGTFDSIRRIHKYGLKIDYKRNININSDDAEQEGITESTIWNWQERLNKSTTEFPFDVYDKNEEILDNSIVDNDTKLQEIQNYYFKERQNNDINMLRKFFNKFNDELEKEDEPKISFDKFLNLPAVNDVNKAVNDYLNNTQNEFEEYTKTKATFRDTIDIDTNKYVNKKINEINDIQDNDAKQEFIDTMYTQILGLEAADSNNASKVIKKDIDNTDKSLRQYKKRTTQKEQRNRLRSAIYRLKKKLLERPSDFDNLPDELKKLFSVKIDYNEQGKLSNVSIKTITKFTKKEKKEIEVPFYNTYSTEELETITSIINSTILNINQLRKDENIAKDSQRKLDEKIKKNEEPKGNITKITKMKTTKGNWRDKITITYDTKINNEFDIQSSIKPNELVLKLLSTNFSKTTKRHVQGLVGDIEVDAWNGKEFFKQNGNILKNANVYELEYAARFFLDARMNLKYNSKEYKTFEAINAYFLMYIYDVGREDGEVSNFNRKLYEECITAYTNIKSIQGAGLGAHKTLLKRINPSKRVFDNDIVIDGIVLDEEEQQILYNAITKGDIKKIGEIQDNIMKRIALESTDRKSKLRQLTSIRQSCMLSGPLTWLRNLVSNFTLKYLYKASDKIGAKVLEGFKNGKNANLFGQQYKLDKPVTPEITEFIKQNFVDNGMFDNLINHLSRFNTNTISKYERDLLGRPTKEAIFSKIVIDSLYSKYYTENTFKNNKNAGKALNGIHKFVMKMLSDTNFVRTATIEYFGKLIAENSRDLSKGITDDIMRDLATSIQLGLSDYMHSDNIFTDIRNAIADKGEVPMFLYDNILPFAATTWNWLKGMLNFTPIGIVKGVMTLTHIEKAVLKADVNYSTQNIKFSRKAIDPQMVSYLAARNVGSGLIGTALMALGLLLGLLGWIDIEEDDYGTPKVKFTIGDAIIKIDISSIFGSSSLLAGAAITSDVKNAGLSWNTIWKGLGASADFLMSSNPMMTVLELDMKRGTILDNTVDWLEKYTLSFIPNLVSFISSGILQTGGTPKKTNFFEKALAKLPFGDLFLEKKRNPYTGKVSTGLFDNTWFNNLVNKAVPYFSYRVAYNNERKTNSLGLTKNELKGSYVINDKKFNVKNTDEINKLYGQLNAKDLSDFYSGKTFMKVKDKNTNKYYILSYNEMNDEQRKNSVSNIMSNNAMLAKIKAWTDAGNYYYASDTLYKNLLKANITKNIYKGDKGYVEK